MLKESNMTSRIQERVLELVYVDQPNLWNTFKNSALKVFPSSFS